MNPNYANASLSPQYFMPPPQFMPQQQLMPQQIASYSMVAPPMMSSPSPSQALAKKLTNLINIELNGNINMPGEQPACPIYPGMTQVMPMQMPPQMQMPMQMPMAQPMPMAMPQQYMPMQTDIQATLPPPPMMPSPLAAPPLPPPPPLPPLPSVPSAPPSVIDQTPPQSTIQPPVPTPIQPQAPIPQPVQAVTSPQTESLTNAIKIIAPGAGDKEPSLEEQTTALKTVNDYINRMGTMDPTAQKEANELLLPNDGKTFKGLASIATADTSSFTGTEKQKADETRVMALLTLGRLQQYFRQEFNNQLKKENIQGIPPIGLGELPGIKAVEHIIKSDSNPEVREAGIYTIMGVADSSNPQDLQVMQSMFEGTMANDSSEKVKKTASDALAAIQQATSLKKAA